MMTKIGNFIHRRFGKKVLKREYREIWVKFWYSTIAILSVIVLFAAIQFLTWLSDLINYVFR